MPGAHAAPQPELIEKPQSYAEKTNIFSPAGPVSLNGKKFFGNPILDNVFYVGSGKISQGQKEVMDKVKQTLSDAYGKSPSFKGMVDLRNQLIKDKMAPRITILPVRDGEHLRQLTGAPPNAGGVTYPQIGVVNLNPDVLKKNPLDNGKELVLDGNRPAFISTDGRHTIVHEMVHALTYSQDKTRSAAEGVARGKLMLGRSNSYDVPPNKNLEFEHNRSPQEMIKIEPKTIPGVKENGAIYIDAHSLIGETDTLTNNIMRDINANNKPRLIYPGISHFAYDANSKPLPGDEPLIMNYILNRDASDGKIDYIYTPFDKNHQEQAKIDAKRLYDRVKFPPGYFTPEKDDL